MATQKQSNPTTKARTTAQWAIIETKWHISRVPTSVRWQLVTFLGPAGSESRGIVDLIAIRKNHKSAGPGLKHGDKMQIIVIQAKGGSAADPTQDDVGRLRRVGRLYRAHKVLLASWKKGEGTRFRRLRDTSTNTGNDWIEVSDLTKIFR